MTTFFTFYSFKGGVGRSMALANVADLFARSGLRVLAIDFDLEAPGLERYFQVEQTAALANPGLIDLLQSFKKSLSGAAPLDERAEFRQLDNFIFKIYPRPLPDGGDLHLLTAGRRTDRSGSAGDEDRAALYRQYALDVRSFDWQDFYDNWEGETFFEWLRSELSEPVGGRQPYDVVLIDARTGVTEMGGVCAYQLADVIVMLCAANHQNMEGTRTVAQDFRSAAVRPRRRTTPLELVVIPARIEPRDDRLRETFFRRFDEFFRDEEPAAFADAGLSLHDLTIPYQPEFAFEEIVVSDPDRRAERRPIGGAFVLLADALTLLASDPDSRLGARRPAALEAIRDALAGDEAPAATAPDSPPDSVSDAPADLVMALENPVRVSRRLRLRTPEATETHFDPTRSFAGFDVFLSSDSPDAESADALAAALEQADFSVFRDRSALTPGDGIAEATTQALHHSRALLLCAGRRGIAPWQKQEVELARASSQSIRIVPVLLAGAEADIFSLALRGVADTVAVDLREGIANQAAFANLTDMLRVRSPAAAGATSAAPTPADNPYAGLAAYGEGQVRLLALPTEVLEQLRATLMTHGLAVLAGASGSGKGSLVAALAASLRSHGGTGASFSVLRVKLDVAEDLARLSQPAWAHQLLVADHADRLPAALGPPGQASLWPAALHERIARASPERPVLLVSNDLPVLAWRRPPSPDAALWARLQPLTTVLAGPAAEAIRTAIETPAARSGFAFEAGLLDRIAQDAGDGPGALSLAQLALQRLWPEAQRGFLTNAAYNAANGIPGLFGAHLERKLAALPAELRLSALALLLRVAVCGEEGRIDWRGAVWEEVCSQPSLLRSGAAALLWLLDARVLSVWRAGPERLLFGLLRPLAPGHAPAVDTLVAGARDRLLRRQRLAASLCYWEGKARAEHALLSGTKLEDAADLVAVWGDELSNAEREFVRLGQARQALVKAQGQRRQRIASAVIGVLVVAAATSMGISWYGKRTLDDNAAAWTSVARSAAPNTIDPALFRDVRIYPQFKAATDRETAGALRFALQALGLQVETPEWVKDATTCGEVRFFHPSDAQRARQLAEAIEQLLRKLGYELAPATVDLSATRLGKTQGGHLEFWLPPLRSLATALPRPPTNPVDGAELRPVPGGCADLGSTDAERRALAGRLGVGYAADIYQDELGPRRVWLDGFLMYRFEVTNEAFAHFKAACQPAPGVSCPGAWSMPAGTAREPARFLPWSQADSYCRWAGGRLPTEDEWEKAARGSDGRIWPWGNEPGDEPYQGRTRSGGNVIVEVGRHPAGDSPYGIADLAGNLWELTATPAPNGLHVMKGGSYLNRLMDVRASRRWSSRLDDKGADYLGFRCILDLAPPSAGGGNF